MCTSNSGSISPGNSMSLEKHSENFSVELPLVNDENKDISKGKIPFISTSEVSNVKVDMGKVKGKAGISLDGSMNLEGTVKAKKENGEVCAVAAMESEANSQDGEGRKDECRRRKGSTPCKKTTEDVRRTLKGTRKNSRASSCSVLKVEDKMKKVDLEPLKILRNHRIVPGAVCISSAVVEEKRIHQLPEFPTSKLLDLESKPEKDSISEEEISDSECKKSVHSLSRVNSPRTYSRRISVQASEEDDKKDSRKYTSGSENSHGLSLCDETTIVVENSVFIPSDNAHNDLSIGTVEEIRCNAVHEVSVEEEVVTNRKRSQQLEVSEDTDSTKHTTKLNSKESSSTKKKLKDVAPNSLRNEERSVTPPKTTRSGRKVIAPNKDMPEPMTPPGKIIQKKRSKSIDLVNTEEGSTEADCLEEEYAVIDENFESNEELSVSPGKKHIQTKITDMFATKSVQSEVSELNLRQENRSALELEMEVEELPPSPVKFSDDGNKNAATSFHDALKQIRSSRSQTLTSETEVSEERKGDSEKDSSDKAKIIESESDANLCIVTIEKQTNGAKIFEVLEENVCEEDGESIEVPCTTSAELMNLHKDPDDTETHIRNGLGGESSIENEKRVEGEVVEYENTVAERSFIDSVKQIPTEEVGQREEQNCEVVCSDLKGYMKEKESGNITEIMGNISDSSYEVLKISQVCEYEDKVNIQLIGGMEEDKNDTGMTDEKSVLYQENTTLKTAIHQLQKDDEKSPEKFAKSKLTSLLGTPEREKRGMKLAGSRAAMLVACAKRNIKKRGTLEEIESPSKDEGDTSMPRGSPSSKNSSPSKTPPNRKRKFSDLDGQDTRPWVRHRPSPGASPSASILKKRAQEEGEAVTANDTPSPPQSKRRRVSFADPPVSERVEIPPSPKYHMRAQKRLDMTKAAAIALKDKDVLEEIDSQDQDTSPSIKCSQPICSSLVSCRKPIDLLAVHLTSPSLVEGLVFLLNQRGITTVGKFCELTEADVVSLPVRTPKVAATRRALEKYKNENNEEQLIDMDGVKLYEEDVIELVSGLDRPENDSMYVHSRTEVKEIENVTKGDNTINLEDELDQDLPVGLEKLLSKDSQDVIDITEEIGECVTGSGERVVKVDEGDKSEEVSMERENTTASDSFQDKDITGESENLSCETFASLSTSSDSESKVYTHQEMSKCLDLLSNPSVNYEIMMQMDHTARRHTLSNLMKFMDQVEIIGLYYEHLQQKQNTTNT